jgi:hypothetical protein
VNISKNGLKDTTKMKAGRSVRRALHKEEMIATCFRVVAVEKK